VTKLEGALSEIDSLICRLIRSPCATAKVWVESEQETIELGAVVFVIGQVMDVATSFWKTVKIEVSGRMAANASLVIECTVRLLTVHVVGAALKAI
jgi:hypothetical protein